MLLESAALKRHSKDGMPGFFNRDYVKRLIARFDVPTRTIGLLIFSRKCAMKQSIMF
jgi:hypothetical protein